MPIFTPDGAAINVNGSTNKVEGLYDVAFVRGATTTFEFFEDAYYRFALNAGHFSITAKTVARPTGVYGYNSNSVTTPGVLPVAAHSATWQAGSATIAVGTFQQISSIAIGVDYDDMQTFWLMTSTAPVKYRVTIMGGSGMSYIIERWDLSKIAATMKITLPN